MRIGFLTKEYVLEGSADGGLANYLAKMTRLLRERGHDPVVFLPSAADRETVVDGIPVVQYRSAQHRAWWLRGWSGTWRGLAHQWLDARRMAAVVEAAHARKPFDILQVPNYGAFGRFMAGRVPVVVRMSSYQPLWRTASGLPRTFDGHMADWLEASQLTRADAVCSPSELVASMVRRLHGVSATVIRSPFVMPPIAEDESLYAERLAGKPYLLFFGSMSRLKGVDVLADALPAVFDANPGVHAVLAGGDGRLPGGRRCGEILRERAAPYPGRLHLLGVQPRERLTPIIRHARIVVLPSRVDNYPNVCLEAQALGKIVVGTRFSSLDEMVEDGVTGLLAAPGSPESLAAAVNRALSLPDGERCRMEAAVRGLAETRSVERSVEDHLALYAATIRGFDARRPARGGLSRS